jgi:Fur family ferric uptake transcriptional regulator
MAKGVGMPASGQTGTSTEFRSGDPKALKERWKEYLAEKRLNTTSQREAIVDQFLKTQDHVSIEELLAKVRKRHPRVGYATVYRTLKLLADSGLAIERHFGDGQSRYEVCGDHHDHLICASCGLILEFEDDEIEKLQEKIAQRLGNFTVVRHRHELYALCPKARGVEGGFCPNDAARRGGGHSR